MMKKKILQVLTVTICLVMVLSGCFGIGEDPSSSSDNSSDGSIAETNSGGKGRYMQKELKIPDKIGTIIKLVQMENGNILLFGNDTEVNVSDNWMLWESEDFGESWNEITPDWVKNLKSLSISSVDFIDPNNAIYFSERFDEEIDAELTELNKSEDPTPEEVAKISELSAEKQEICLVEDSVTKKIGTLPPPEETSYYLTNFVLGKNGSIVASSYNSIFALNPETAEIAGFKIENNGNNKGSYTVFENTVYVISDSTITIYDLEEKADKKEIQISDTTEPAVAQYGRGFNDNIMALSPDGKDLYYANNNGIFHVIPEGEVIERIADGSLTSLGSPSTSLNSLVANSEDSSFIVYLSDNGKPYLYKYYYDPNVSSAPTKELNVYTLNSVSTRNFMQQAASMYHLENPDVKINCIVGSDKQNGVTIEDALKNISAEILAGKGPDVLVLDDMPIKSYIDKGVLLDISDLLASDIESDTYVKSIVETFKKENSIYAIPTRFRVTGILQSGGINVNSFEELLAYYEANPDDTSTMFLDDLHYFYPFLTKDWFLEDGNLDTEAMKASLPLLERYSKLFKPMQDEQYSVVGDALSVGVLYANDVADVAIGDIYSISDLETPFSAIKKRNVNGSFSLFPKEDKMYTPTSIMGVNSNSNKQDMAKDFIQFTLSEKVQAVNIYSGIPVNKAAIAASVISPYPEGDDGSVMAMGFTLAATEVSDEGFTEDAIIEDSSSSDDTVEENIVVEGSSSVDAVPEDSRDESTTEYSIAAESTIIESYDGNEYTFFELRTYWPTEEEFNSFVSQFETLNTPYIENAILKDIIMETILTFDDEAGTTSINSSDYIENEITQKLAIYLAE